jgi:Spy/CpxP family protein refolding chaperone
MRKFTGKLSWLLLLALSAAIGPFSSAQAQSGAGNAQQPLPPEAQRPAPPRDPIRDLNLSAEQLAKIRAIREQNREERAAVNRRVRVGRMALDEALDSDNPSEELIERQARELGEAQSASLRMQAITEIRIRRVLTLEQLLRLRQLRLQAQRAREQRLETGGNPGNQRNGVRQPPNQRNGVGPLNQRRRDALQRKPGN